MRQLTATDLDAVGKLAALMGAGGDAELDGAEGLVHAARSFDPDRGPWVKHRNRVVARAIVDGYRRTNGRRTSASERSRVYVDRDDEPTFSRPQVLSLDALSTELPMEDTALDGVVQELVRSTVKRLPQQDQLVAWASVADGGQRRLAEQLGLTEGAITLRKRKVYARLRTLLADVA